MRLAPLIRWTIKARIAIAFLAMGGTCLALGGMTVMSAHRADQIVRLTYDNILIANSYARAAASDFANLRTEVEHQQLAAKGRKDRTDAVGSALHASFQADVATAAEKADSPEVGERADDLRQAETEWRATSRSLDKTSAEADLTDFEARTRAVEEKIEALVSAVADRGLAFRSKAQSEVDHDVRLALIGVAAAILIGGLVAVMLCRRISGPIGEAARFARDIAAGALDGDPPRAQGDEIGDLIRAMVAMRSDIAAMMSEQVVLREQSQARIAAALEGSHEGVVVVDPRGVIQIANRRALDWLGIAKDRVAAGDTMASLIGRMSRNGSTRPALLQMNGLAPETEEMQLSDGRWIRSSRHCTSEGGLVALFTEITAIKDQQDRLAEANLTLDAALRNMSQGLCLFDPQDRLKLANSRFRALFSLSEDNCAPGTPYRDIVAQVLVGAGGTTFGLDRLMRHEGAVIRRRRCIHRSVALGGRTIAIAQQPMAEGGWLATYEDVTERKRAEAQIAFLANHDALTHLPNRTTFGKRVEDAVVRLRRGGSFAIHCIDLDHFKQVNDTLGHALGDQLLRAVTDRLRDCVREGDTVARLGGDEFAILQNDISGPEQVAALADRIVRTLSEPYVIDGHDITVAASIGIALSPNDGRTHGVLLKSADAALYKAKEDGRRTWRFFELAMDETLQARHALEGDLRRAVQNHEFEVFYQPLLEARSGQIRGFEALVRWRHPSRGLVLPDEFISVAEEIGVIKDIGRWVMQAACREAVRWPTHMRVAVNVSTIQLRDANFIDIVIDAMTASGLSPDRLELEITESVFMASTTQITPLLIALRGIGVRFAIDDFGTGYSSLSTLRAFPFDKIKIDRSFVRDMVVAEAAGQIIRTILALGRSLGMRVTAEGVESRSQLHFLEQEGCDEIQGYLVGRPMPAGDVIERLARHSDRGWIEKAA